MADSGDSDVNRKALQRVDPYIVQILESATQVALYRFVAKDNEWDKTGVEGSLFVYRRSAPPQHGFIIMNRLSKTNQIEPITKDLELQKEDPYLLYRNSKLNIFGIWFYDRNDCIKICDLTSRLLEQEKDRSRLQQRTRRASESDTVPVDGSQPKNTDILSLLNKAQGVYVKNKNTKGSLISKTITEPKMMIGSPTSGTAASTSSDLVRPKAVRIGGAPDVTRTSPTASSAIQKPTTQEESLTLEALFASATLGQGPSSSSLDSLASTTTSAGAQPLTPVITPANSLLQRLMSNPEHLVEHIERQQRNEFPASSMTGTDLLQPTAESLEKSLKEKLKLGTYGSIGTASSKVSAPSAAESGVVGPSTSASKSAASSSLPPIIPLAKMQTILTPAMLESAILNTSTGPLSSSGLALQALHSPLPSDVVTTPFSFAAPSKMLPPPPPPPMPQVSLMSPMMFVATPRPRTISPLVRNGFDDRTKATAESDDVFPLAKSQLCQVLIYLLKNDAEFLTKLHETYIKLTSDGSTNVGKT